MMLLPKLIVPILESCFQNLSYVIAVHSDLVFIQSLDMSSTKKPATREGERPNTSGFKH